MHTVRGMALPEALSQSAARPTHSRGCEATFIAASLISPVLGLSLYTAHIVPSGMQQQQVSVIRRLHNQTASMLRSCMLKAEERPPAGSLGSFLGCIDCHCAVQWTHGLLQLTSPPASSLHEEVC